MACWKGPLFRQLPNGLNVCLSFPSAPRGKLWKGPADKGEKRAKSGKQWQSVSEEEHHGCLKRPLCANMLIVQMSQSLFHILLAECFISEHETKNYIKIPCLNQ